MRIFPHVHSYQIRMDMLTRFMTISYVYIERLKDLNASCAVEISCLESLLQIRADVIRSENKQVQMDELSINCYNLMNQVSFVVKVPFIILY